MYIDYTFSSFQGAVPKGNATKEMIQHLGLREGQVIYKCPKCCCIKPSRAHHCSVCQRYVQNQLNIQSSSLPSSQLFGISYSFSKLSLDLIYHIISITLCQFFQPFFLSIFILTCILSASNSLLQEILIIIFSQSSLSYPFSLFHSFTLALLSLLHSFSILYFVYCPTL